MVRVTAALVFLFFGFVLVPVLQVATGDIDFWSILVIGVSAIMLLIFMPWGGSWARRLRKRTEATQPDALVSIVQLIGPRSGIAVLTADDRGITISGKSEPVVQLRWEEIRDVQTVTASLAEERVVLEMDGGGASVEFLPLSDNGRQRLTAARFDLFLSELRTFAHKRRAKS